MEGLANQTRYKQTNREEIHSCRIRTPRVAEPPCPRTKSTRSVLILRRTVTKFRIQQRTVPITFLKKIKIYLNSLENQLFKIVKLFINKKRITIL